MINVNGKIILELSDVAFKLISALCDYGKECHPSNEVLLKKCGWGNNIRKLTKAKKELTDKGFISIQDRYKYTDEGRKVRASNKYVINTDLVSKYNGNIQMCNSELFKNETFKYEQFTFEQLKNELVDFELCQKRIDNKLLKLISIETIQLLKEDYLLKEKEKKENLEEIERLKNQIKKLKSKKSSERKKVAVNNNIDNSLLKKKETQTIFSKKQCLGKKEKGCGQKEQKESHLFPDISPTKEYNIQDKRTNKRMPFDTQTAYATVSSFDFEECRAYLQGVLNVEIDEDFFKDACHSFATVAVATYREYMGITSFRKLKDKFMSWLNSHYKYTKSIPSSYKKKNDNGGSNNPFFCE